MTKRPLPPRGELLTRPQATALLQSTGYPVGNSTLAHAAERDIGPPFIRFGNRTFYEKKSLLAWAESRLQVFGKNSDNPFAPRGGDPANQIAAV